MKTYWKIEIYGDDLTETDMLDILALLSNSDHRYMDATQVKKVREDGS